MLMDTILGGVPMPKVFLATEIRAGKTHRIVIDGQQRLSAILAFLRDEFALDRPYQGPHAGKVFSDFTEDEANEFLSYKIDFNEAVGPTDKEVREVYSRVNKYTVPLNKQELRRADFPGDFLNVSEELAVHPYLDDARIFSPAQRRRYADVEFVSEILAAMLNGIQDKKGDLDELYRDLAAWPKSARQATVAEFEDAITQLKLIFDENPIANTRFRQKADFYSLFIVLVELRREGGTLAGKPLEELQEDIKILDFNIEPESYVRVLSEYAIKCVSQANTAASRNFRHGILKAVLTGTFHSRRPSPEAAEMFTNILSDLSFGSGMCEPAGRECPVCDREVQPGPPDGVIGWGAGDKVFQMSNACFVHIEECAEQADRDQLYSTVAPTEDDDRQQNLF